MEGLEAVNAWLVAHKEGAVTFGVLVTPLIALVGTIYAARTSYRASVQGPITQRAIADQQIAFQRRQARASLQGTYDQRWIADFRTAVASAVTITDSINTLKGTLSLVAKNAHRQPSVDKFTREIDEKMDKAVELIHNIELLLSDEVEITELIGGLRHMAVIDDNGAEFEALRSGVIMAARKVIARRLKAAEGHLEPSDPMG